MVESTRCPNSVALESVEPSPELLEAIKKELGTFVTEVTTVDILASSDFPRHDEHRDTEVNGFSMPINVIHVRQRVPFATRDLLTSWFQQEQIISMLNSIVVKQRTDFTNLQEDVSIENTEQDPVEKNGVCDVFSIDGMAFLDIETLGLDDAPIITLGMASIKSGEIVVDQFIVFSIKDEFSCLIHGIELLSFNNVSTIITFYGKKFDLPYLQKRLDIVASNSVSNESSQNQGERFANLIHILNGCNHLDLHDLFKSLYPGLGRYNFKALEHEVLGLGERQGDINGSQISQQYARFQSAIEIIDKARAISTIIKHNFTDIVHSAFAFHAMISNIVGSRSSKKYSKKRRKKIGELNLNYDFNPLQYSDSVPRTCPIIINQTSCFLQDTTIIEEIISCFNDGIDIQAARQILASKNQSLLEQVDRQGWFYFLERCRDVGLLDREVLDDKILYKRANGSLDLTNSQLVALTRDLAIIGESPGPLPSTSNLAELDAIPTKITSGHSDGNVIIKPVIENSADSVDTRQEYREHEDNRKTFAQSDIDETSSNDTTEILDSAGQFTSRIFRDASLQNILKGWLVSCGSLNIDDAAKVLGVSPLDIKVFLFEQVGKGYIRVKFKDNLFWIPKNNPSIENQEKDY